MLLFVLSRVINEDHPLAHLSMNDRYQLNRRIIQSSCMFGARQDKRDIQEIHI